MLLSLFCSSSSLLLSCFLLLSSSHIKSTKNKKSSTIGQLDWLMTDAMFTHVADAQLFHFLQCWKKVHSHFSWHQICQWAKINPAVFKTFLLVLVIFNNKSIFFLGKQQNGIYNSLWTYPVNTRLKAKTRIIYTVHVKWLCKWLTTSKLTVNSVTKHFLWNEDKSRR